MANSKLFDFAVNDFDDVRDHLDALWYEFNQLASGLGGLNTVRVGPGCTNPPDTCGFQEKKRPPKQGQRKRPVKRAKP